MLRSTLRRVKAQSLRFQKEKPAVLVFGNRRGGSTMVSDGVSASPGVWFSNEPYAMFPNRPGFAEKKARLFTPEHSHFFGLEGADLERFSSFSNDLLLAKFRKMGTSRHTLPMLRSNRVCLKILNAPWMVDWFLEKTDSHVVSVLRHPGAQARSVLRQGWQFPIEAYLARPEFLARTFSEKQIGFAQDVFASGDQWRIAVLDWVITSHPLRKTDHERFHGFDYDEIVRNPENFVRNFLGSELGLADEEGMLSAILRPSGSSKMSQQAASDAISARDVDTIINRWRDATSDDELQQGQSILDIFEVENFAF